MSVRAAQRFSQSRPCPICGGHVTVPSGKGERCYGFLSSDGRYAHCTREEQAGGLGRKEASGTYPHVLEGECGCGARHGDTTTATKVRRNGHEKAPQGKPTASWPVKDRSGETRAIHVRFDRGPKDKECLWRLPGAEPRDWGLQGLKLAELPLYRSECAAEWPEDLPVVVTEGEKAADALAGVHPATLGTVTGASGAPDAEALEVLRGRSVVLWPDNDPEGREHMKRVAERVRGVASEVRIFEWEEAPEKGADAADHPAVRNGRRSEAEKLLEAMTAVPTYDPGSEVSPVSPPYKEQGRGHRLRSVRFNEIPDPGPRRYLLDGLIPEGYPTLLHGDGGVAKSMIALSFGLAVARGGRGVRWLGRHVGGGGAVLYADFELDAAEQRRRVNRLARAEGLERVPDSFRYMSALGHPAREAFGAALEECREHGVRLLIVDSYGVALQGDAGAARDVIGFNQEVLEPFRAAGVTVLIVDHQSRLQVGERYQNKSAFGSVYKTNLCRSVIQAEAKERGEGTLTVRLRQKKHNFGPLAAPFDAELTFTEEMVTLQAKGLEAAELAEEQTLNAADRVKLALGDGPAFPAEIAEGTGLALKTVKNALSRLRGDGKVRDTGEKDGQSMQVSLVSPSPINTRDGDASGDGGRQAPDEHPEDCLCLECLPA